MWTKIIELNSLYALILYYILQYVKRGENTWCGGGSGFSNSIVVSYKLSVRTATYLFYNWVGVTHYNITPTG